MSDLACPHCGAAIENGRKYCAHCARRAVDFALCPECEEPISTAARYCPHCTQRVRRAAVIEVDEPVELDLEIRATRLGSLLDAGSFPGFVRPARVLARESTLRVLTPALGGLTFTERSIPLHQIRRVRSVPGPLWGGIVVESEGSAEDGEVAVRGLRKREANYLVFHLRSATGASGEEP
ncbi:MAG: zinc ribbon domain-containing protein [Phycisphaerales bacterium]